MKKQLENALQAIPLPDDLDDAAIRGIQRAQKMKSINMHSERKGNEMTKTIKIIAATAASLAVSFAAIAGASIISGNSLRSIPDGSNELISRQLDQAEDYVDVSLLRQENGSGYKVVALLNDSAKDADFYGEIDSIRPAEFVLVNDRGETVAEGKPDGTIDIDVSQHINIITEDDGSMVVVFDAEGESQDYRIVINKLIGSKDGNDIIEFFGNWGDGIDLRFTPSTTVSYVEMDENGNFVYYDENGNPIEDIQREMEVPDKTSSTYNFDNPPFNETFEMAEDGFDESVNAANNIPYVADDGVKL